MSDPEPREHDTDDENCWCHPTLFYKAPNGNVVYVHNDPDDDEGPPPEALMEAIIYANMDLLPEEDTGGDEDD